jgi:hypothetical protein
MLLSLSANPVPTDLYNFVRGSTSPTALPWYIWGGGVYATKYGFNPATHWGYQGTVSVPLVGAPNCPVIVKSLRVLGSVTGKQGPNEGAQLIVNLYERTGNMAQFLATISVNNTNVVVSNPYIDITQSAGNFAATPSIHSLAIELIGLGQGIATVTGLFVDFQY